MKSSVVVAIMIVLCLAVSAFAQTDRQLINFNFDFAPGGARAEAMGRTGIALSDDINGGSGNPAGLWVHDGTKFGIGWGVLSPRGSTIFDDISGTTTKEHVGSFNNLASINFVAPVRVKGHKFVGTVNYSRVYDEYNSFDAVASYLLPDSTQVGGGFWVLNDDPSNVGQTAVRQFRQGGLNVFNLGFGTKIYTDFSFGLTVNIYSGSVVNDISEARIWDDVYTNNLLLGQHAQYLFRTSVVDTIKFSGLNFNLGFKYEQEKWSAGLMVRTPISLNVSTDETILVTLHVDDFEIRDFRGSSLSTKIEPPLAKYDLPLMVSGGFAFKANENLLLTTDLEYRSYGSSATIRIRDSINIGSSGDITEFFREFDPAEERFMRWQDAIVFRIGGEYTKEFSFGTVPVRAGFSYVPIPASSINIDGTDSQAKSYNLSFGSGIHWEQISLDFAYTYTMRDRQEQVIDYSYKNHHLNFAFTGVF